MSQPMAGGASALEGGGTDVALVNGRKNARSMVSENALIVFGRRGCCMCHVVKLLLQGLGVNPTVYEVDEHEVDAVVRELEAAGSGSGDEGTGVIDGLLQFPAVFVGGKLFGGLEKVMSMHISGQLVPILKDAGALWL